MNRFNPLNKTLDTILNKEMASIKVSWHAQINLSCLRLVSEITPLVDSILHGVQLWLLHSLDMILHCLGARSAIQAYSCTV